MITVSRDLEQPPSGLSAHILPTSATMLGVCMTVLSIGHLGPGGKLRMGVDKLLAVDPSLARCQFHNEAVVGRFARMPR